MEVLHTDAVNSFLPTVEKTQDTHNIDNVVSTIDTTSHADDRRRSIGALSIPEMITTAERDRAFNNYDASAESIRTVEERKSTYSHSPFLHPIDHISNEKLLKNQTQIDKTLDDTTMEAKESDSPVTVEQFISDTPSNIKIVQSEQNPQVPQLNALISSFPEVSTPSSICLSRRCSRDTLSVADSASLPIPGSLRTTPATVIQRMSLLRDSSSCSSVLTASKFLSGAENRGPQLFDRIAQPIDPQRQESAPSLLGAMTRRRTSIASSELPSLIPQQ